MESSYNYLMKINLDRAVELIKEGNVLAVPTETVYGLAASLYCEKAVKEIFHIKGRPSNNPLIIHVNSLEDIFSFIKENEKNRLHFELHLLAKKFWPGPLTLVLPVEKTLIFESVRAGLSTAAFRIPSHLLTRELLKKTGPLVMPSANRSGRPSATEYRHIENDFGKDFPVLDGGICKCGLESTILINQEGRWEIARLGILIPEDFESTLGYVPKILQKTDSILCPGQLHKHYSPKCRLEKEGDIVLGYRNRIYLNKKKVYYLGDLEDPFTVAESLYRTLRKLDEDSIESVFLDLEIPEIGLWKTIRERLERAAIK